MTTDTDAKYTLIHYQPDEDEYLGCGDYERHHSNLGFEMGLSFEQLRHRINTLTKNRRFTEDDAPQFAILLDGKPLISRGEAMWSFDVENENTPEWLALDALFHEANILSEKEKKEAADARRKEEEEKQRKYREAEETRRYADAKRTITEYEAKQKREAP